MTRPRITIIRPGAAASQRAKGFSLVEVMVALAVTSVGLLGLAKMESLALMSTNVSSSRSLAALQASSLAAAMHADSDYWSNVAPPVTTVDSSTANNFATLAASNLCLTSGTSSCNPQQMAFVDLYNWGIALGQLLPGYQAIITCTSTTPMACSIQISWAENGIANNANQNSMSSLAAPTYTVDVQP